MPKYYRSNDQQDSAASTMSTSAILMLGALALSLGLTALLTAIVAGYGVDMRIRLRLFFFVLFLIPLTLVVIFRASELRSKRKDTFLVSQPFTVEEQWIPDREVEKLRSRLRRSKSGKSLPEVKVLCITHRQPFAMWYPVTVCSLIGLSLVIWGFHLYNEGWGNKRFWSHCAYTVLLLYLATTTVLAFMALHFVLKWRSEIFVVRDPSIEWWRNPPSWAFWMDDDTDELASLDDVLLLEVRKSRWGRIFGFGTLTADTASQRDGKFQDQHYMPTPEKIRTIISEAKERRNSPDTRQESLTTGKRPHVSKDRRRS